MKNLIERCVVSKHQGHIRAFCSKYHTRLKKVDVTEERGYTEPAYVFLDNLGFYTIDGIKNSLR